MPDRGDRPRVKTSNRSVRENDAWTSSDFPELDSAGRRPFYWRLGDGSSLRELSYSAIASIESVI
jgi:hypothetical protein